MPFPVLSYLTSLPGEGFKRGSIVIAAKKAPMKNTDWKARSHEFAIVRTLNRSECREFL